MSNSVVPAAAAAQAKHLVRNKKLTKQTEDQKPVHNEHDEQKPSDQEPEKANAVQTEEAEKQASSMSDISLSGDFTFAAALAEAAEGSAELTSEVEAAQDDGGYGDDDDGGSGGTILLVGALGLVGAGIAVAASGGGKSNEPPTADASQSVTTAEDTPVNVAVNASDPDGDTLTYTVSTQPSNGTTSVSGGTVTYSPGTDFNGSDSFVVTVTDPDGASVTQTVNVTVTPVNDAPKPTAANTSSLTLAEDTTAPFVIDFDDPEGDAVTVALVTGPANGTIGAGDVYIPNANFNGSDSITYQVSDSNGASTTFTLNITVTPVNDDPVTDASQDAVTTETDPVDVTVTATDVDGDTLTYSVSTDPANGMVVDNGDGSFTYTADVDFTGDDSFVVTVDDGNGGTAMQTVNVTVNPSSISIDGDNPAGPARIIDADGGAFVYTDDSGINTNVIINNFGEDDLIIVSGATVDQYAFSTGSDPNDIEITFSPQAGVNNIILLNDVLDGAPFFDDYAGALAAAGFADDFMTFA